MLLVDGVLLLLNNFPFALCEPGEECIGLLWRVVNLCEAKNVGKRQGGLVEGLASYYVYNLLLLIFFFLPT